MNDQTANRSLPPELIAELQFQRDVLPKIRREGEESLRRLLPIAQSGTGQSGVVARFLLGLYNGPAYPFDLTDLRRLDQGIVDDCLSVLRMDHRLLKEVHEYFANGNEIFQNLADIWMVKPNSTALLNAETKIGVANEIVNPNPSVSKDSSRVVWQSRFLLKDSEESKEAYSLSVTRYGDRSVRVSVAQPGDDIDKEFESPQAAYIWLRDFSEGQHLELEPLCDFDFRAIVE